MHPILLAIALLAASAASTPRASLLAPADDPELDTVTLSGKRAKQLRGRVIERNDPEYLVLFEGRKCRKIPLADVAGIQTLRDNLATFLAERVSPSTRSGPW